MHEPPSPGGLAAASQPAGEPGARASLGALLAEVTALASQLRKLRTAAPSGDDSLWGGWSILQTLGRLGPQTVPDIARARGMSRQNIQVLVNRLESQGYVALTPNPAHKRSGLVELTGRGRRSLAVVIEQEAASLEALLPHVAQSRLVPAARLLRQLRELLAGKQSPPPGLAEARPAPEPAQAPRRPAGQRKPVPSPVTSADAVEPMAPDESEFPVNLL
jgi:DNA-binding MarR family transcriptional regulator